MMDKYYTMRTMDRALQLMYRYEDKNVLENHIIVEYMISRKAMVADIFALLQ